VKSHALILLALTFLAGCDRPQPPSTSKTIPAPIATTQPVNNTLPQIDLPGLQALLKDAADNNQVVIVDFWATWCSPCVEMFPVIHEGVDKLGPGVRLITITLDDPEDSPQAIAFLSKHHALKDAYLMVPDSDKQLALVAGLGKNWDSLVVPALFVFGKDGKLKAQLTQGVKPSQAIDAAAQALKEAPVPNVPN
jgi:thiol-disulfide isomerase/thioredoxin